MISTIPLYSISPSLDKLNSKFDPSSFFNLIPFLSLEENINALNSSSPEIYQLEKKKKKKKKKKKIF